MENITELATQIRIEPYSEDGVEGLSLSNIKPNSIFRRMGLRNGDVLVAVDGQSLTSVDQAMKLYEDLKTSDTANLEINRKSRSINFQYKIR
jgi:general secretion pathway protein C